MRIWVDADACPATIREILFRAADRWQVGVILVANRALRTPPSPHVRAIQVPGGFDVADERIAQEAQAGDLVVTADVPLAAKIVAKGAVGLDPRGELYTSNNIDERVSVRNFMTGLRDGGVDTGGPRQLDHAARKAFADQLDRWLARNRPA